MRSEKSEEMLGAIREEMSSLSENQTWDLVPRPKDKTMVGCKWVYKIKEGTSESEPVRYKAKLVSKRYTQKEGIKCNEIFSPIVKYRCLTVHW